MAPFDEEPAPEPNGPQDHAVQAIVAFEIEAIKARRGDAVSAMVRHLSEDLLDITINVIRPDDSAALSRSNHAPHISHISRNDRDAETQSFKSHVRAAFGI